MLVREVAWFSARPILASGSRLSWIHSSQEHGGTRREYHPQSQRCDMPKIKELVMGNTRIPSSPHPAIHPLPTQPACPSITPIWSYPPTHLPTIHSSLIHVSTPLPIHPLPYSVTTHPYTPPHPTYPTHWSSHYPPPYGHTLPTYPLNPSITHPSAHPLPHLPIYPPFHTPSYPLPHPSPTPLSTHTSTPPPIHIPPTQPIGPSINPPIWPHFIHSSPQPIHHSLCTHPFPLPTHPFPHFFLHHPSTCHLCTHLSLYPPIWPPSTHSSSPSTHPSLIRTPIPLPFLCNDWTVP